MKAWLERFMYRRYGQDDLNRFLSILVLILCIASIFVHWVVLNSLTLILLFVNVFRMLSRNPERRGRENFAFLRVQERAVQFVSRLQSRFLQRKTHRFFKCPVCGRHLRVPRGKGRVEISCPQCRKSFVRKT